MGSVITPNTIDDIQRIYAGSFRRVRRGTASEERSITLNDTKAKTPGPKRRCQGSRALQLPCASKTVLRGRAGLIDRLFANKVLDRLRSAQGVISLAKALRAGRLEAACHRALAFENIGCRSVKTILDKSLDQVADPEDAFDTLGDAYTGSARFGRDPRDLFEPH